MVKERETIIQGVLIVKGNEGGEEGRGRDVSGRCTEDIGPR